MGATANDKNQLTSSGISDKFSTTKAFTFLAVHFLAASAASNIQTGSVRRNLNALYPNQTSQRGFIEEDRMPPADILFQRRKLDGEETEPPV